MQTFLECVDGKFLVALKHHKIVPVAFVIAEKQVLAVGGVNVLPIFKSEFYCRERWMVVGLELYPLCVEEFLNFFCLFADHVNLFEWRTKIRLFLIIFV